MLYYDDKLKASEFFEFFGIHETKRIADKETIQIYHKPGGFEKNIDIYVSIDASSQVVLATLFLDREWIGNEEKVNPFGKDIAKSFVSAMVPPEDLEGVEDLVKALWNLRGTKDHVIVLNDAALDEEVPDKIKDAILVYLVKEMEFELPLKCCKVSFENLFHEGRERLRIMVEHDRLTPG